MFWEKDPSFMSRKKTAQKNPAALFADPESLHSREDHSFEPLAYRMRPGILSEFIGQSHILSEGSLLRRAIDAGRLSSVIFYGPPGTGKTTLAHCISAATNAVFVSLNAVSSNVEELRRSIAAAKLRLKASGQRTILFIDEIHRFSRAQQDVLMPDVEEGNVVLIGATVQNPFFALISPLISRSLVFEFLALEEEDLSRIMKRALADRKKGLGHLGIKADQEALRFLARACGGDARRCLNALEIAVSHFDLGSKKPLRLSLKDVEECVQKRAVVYDRDDDAHYDVISAFIKSMRGSDPDATLYWLAKMLSAGEEPRFIGRRICICASEDVGNADPHALVLAQAAFAVSEFIGMPEARIPLAQAAVYVACAPKSNAAYLGIERALREVKNGPLRAVPAHLKDSSYPGAKNLGRGEGYLYPHDFPAHHVAQEYMPGKVCFYEPQETGYEKKIKERLAFLRSRTENKET